MRSNIGKLIEISGLQKKYIAKELNVSQGTITNWAKGRAWPRLDQAVKLAKILRCKITDMYEEIN